MDKKIKVKVRKAFRDKENDEVLQAKGKILEITEERMKEINTAGFGNLVAKYKEPEKEPGENSNKKESKNTSKKGSKKSSKKK